MKTWRYKKVTIERVNNGYFRYAASIGWRLLQADTLDGMKRLITKTLQGGQ